MLLGKVFETTLLKECPVLVSLWLGESPLLGV